MLDVVEKRCNLFRFMRELLKAKISQIGCVLVKKLTHYILNIFLNLDLVDTKNFKFILTLESLIANSLFIPREFEVGSRLEVIRKHANMQKAS